MNSYTRCYVHQQRMFLDAGAPELRDPGSWDTSATGARLGARRFLRQCVGCSSCMWQRYQLS